MKRFDHYDGLDPEYIHSLRQAEIDSAESVVPEDKRKPLTDWDLKEMQDSIARRIEKICNG